jgi:hypothetical protein
MVEFRTNISQWFGAMFMPTAVFSHPLVPLEIHVAQVVQQEENETKELP